MQEKSNRKILIIIFLISFSVGIFFIIFNPMPYGDQSDYDIHARNLLNGNGISLSTRPPYFPDVYRTPGMGIFLYLIYKVFGINYVVVKVIQAALNAVVPVLIFYLCKNTFNERFAYIAAFVVALYPFTTLFVPVISSETLCIFLFALGIFLFEKGRKSKKILPLAISGITFGYCLLVRPGTALFPLFMTITYLVVANIKEIWKHLLIFNIFVILLWSPWIVRNYLVSGRFIPLTIEGNEMVYWATGSIGEYYENRMNNTKFVHQMKEINQKLKESGLTGMEKVIKEEQLYLEYAFRNIKDDPFLYLWATIKRIPRMWITIINYDVGRSYGYKVRGGSQFLFVFVKYFTMSNLFLAVYGIWVLRHKWREIIFMAIPIFYFSLTHMVILTEGRFTLPARPFMTIFTLVGFLYLLEKVLKKFKIPFSNPISPHA